MTFAERLRELREAAGLTQAQLAEKSELPIGSIRNYEQGQREPYWTVVFKLAEALGVTCEAFKDCIDSPPPAEPPGRRRAGKAADQEQGKGSKPAGKGRGKKGKGE